MGEWKHYRKSGVIEAREYIVGESLEGKSVSPNDVPTSGGMIARDAKNHADEWYISPGYFAANYEEA